MIAPLYIATKIVDAAGGVNIFFLQRWEEIRTGLGLVPAKGVVNPSGVASASEVTQLLFTTTQAGIYRMTFSIRRTAVDGAGSTLIFTGHWTDGGTPLSFAFPVNNTDTTGSLYTGTMEVPIDVNTPVTYDIAYTSTTPGQMKYKRLVTLELLAAA